MRLSAFHRLEQCRVIREKVKLHRSFGSVGAPAAGGCVACLEVEPGLAPSFRIGPGQLELLCGLPVPATVLLQAFLAGGAAQPSVSRGVSGESGCKPSCLSFSRRVN